MPLRRKVRRLSTRIVTAGPAEGTSIGNLLVQMISADDISGLNEAREIVKQSFTIIEY